MTKPRNCTAKTLSCKLAACDSGVSFYFSPADCRRCTYNADQALLADYTTSLLEYSSAIMTLHNSTLIHLYSPADHARTSVLQVAPTHGVINWEAIQW